jgi:hypothetical protein
VVLTLKVFIHLEAVAEVHSSRCARKSSREAHLGKPPNLDGSAREHGRWLNGIFKSIMDPRREKGVRDDIVIVRFLVWFFNVFTLGKKSGEDLAGRSLTSTVRRWTLLN